MAHRELYDVLGVAAGATEDQIRRAYKKAALKWHPDKNTDNKEEAERMFKKVSEAYEVLSNAEARQRYDRFGMDGVNSNGSSGPSTRSAYQGGGFGADPTFGMGGFGAGGRSRPFAFHDPFQVFQDFFGNDDDMLQALFGVPPSRDRGGARGANQQQRRAPAGMRSLFDDDDDGFGMGMGGFGMMGGLGGHRSMMSQMMSGGGMGNGTGMTSISMSSSSFGGPSGVSRSVSTTTEVRDGRRITKKVTRTQDSQGNVTEDVEEQIEDIGGGSGGRIRNNSSGSGFYGRLQ